MTALHIVSTSGSQRAGLPLIKRAVPMLVERDAVCAQLVASVGRAEAGEGTCVLLGGEAGVGKTSLMLWLEAMVSADARVLWGACEALNTPRPLGPLHDMAHELGGSRAGSQSLSVSQLLRSGAAQASVFDALAENLREQSKPTVLLFEDLHWADQGTLDLIRFLGRRVSRQAVVLVLSYRDDEVDAKHPFRAVIGDLPVQSTLRLQLTPLSETGVRLLAGSDRSDRARLEKLHAITGGNPLFVTEVLAALDAGQDMQVPSSIRDAVLARTNRLPILPRSVLDLVSVVPGKIERVLVQEMIGEHAESAIAECLLRGLLVEVESADGRALTATITAITTAAAGALMFRHELVRLAIEAALPRAASRALHKRLIDAQRHRADVSAARLVHHALALGDAPLVLELAQRAALEAAALGAHREAAAHFAAALNVAANAPDEVRAQLHESWSYEAGLIKVDDAAIAARHQAIVLWRQLGNHEKVGLNLRWLSRLVWYRGDGAAAERFLDEALIVLRNIPACAEQAWACSVRSQMYMLNNLTDQAIEWGERALKLADELNVPEVRVHSLNNIGTSLLLSGRAGGLERMEESLRLALAGGFHEQAARVYTNVASYGERFRDFAVAEKYAVEGLEFDRRHDLDSWTNYLAGVHAQLRLQQGHFAEAEAIAREALATPHLTTVMRLPALGVLGQLRMRQGHADGHQQLSEGLAMALPTKEAQRITPFATALAEYAWLQDDAEGVRRALAALDGLTGVDANPWDFGDVVIWRHRIGESVADLVDKVAAPYATEIRGDVESAAQQWRGIGDPYSAAMVLAQAKDGGAQEKWLAAIDGFAALGAEPAARKVRQRARAEGVRGIRRGPYAATKQNQFGLTAKELDVLRLLVADKTNQEISEHLSRSQKTVEHHVSSVLGKLGARNRAEAAKIAIREQLLADGAAI
jgi:DNA-binding CsgD family transcriptional regulator/tetratricopeptide (TPR) repeat protein